MSHTTAYITFDTLIYHFGGAESLAFRLAALLPDVGLHLIF
jgi:hypothetical protein